MYFSVLSADRFLAHLDDSLELHLLVEVRYTSFPEKLTDFLLLPSYCSEPVFITTQSSYIVELSLLFLTCCCSLYLLFSTLLLLPHLVNYSCWSLGARILLPLKSELKDPLSFCSSLVITVFNGCLSMIL